MPEEEPPEPAVNRVALDDIQKQQVYDTLARPDVNYNLSACAKLLGIHVTTVHSIVDRDPVLLAKCPSKNPNRMLPADTDLLDREPTNQVGGIVLTKDQAVLMREMVRQNDRVVKKGWKDLGLSEEDAQTMEDAERRAALPIGRVLAASEGHLLALVARSAQILDKLGDQLVKGAKSKHGALPKITDIAGSDKSEVEYLKVYQNGIMTHVNIQQTLLKTRAATIDAMAKLKAMKDSADKPEKGVFVPTNAAPNNK